MANKDKERQEQVEETKQVKRNDPQRGQNINDQDDDYMRTDDMQTGNRKQQSPGENKPANQAPGRKS